MKNPVPILPVLDQPARPLSSWLLVPLGLLLLLLSVGCSKEKLLSVLPKVGGGSKALQLSEVLPGRWSINAKGYHYTVHFGRHSEMSLVLDVPPEYRARLKLDQIWVGGNYHTSGEYVYITFTDGRFAEMLAQLHGLRVREAKVASFTNDKVVDSEQDTWERIGSEPTGPLSEARDLADTAPAGKSTDVAPPPIAVPGAAAAPDSGAQTKHLKAERAKLAAVYTKLEKRRRSLNLKDPKALAAFNKDATDYAKQVALLNASVGSTTPQGGLNPPSTAIPIMATTADAGVKAAAR